MAEKIFTNVRLGLKVDTLEKWNASSLVLKRGEIAFATTAASVGTGLTEPVCMMKIGDGEHVFKDLEWNFYAKASDVLAACKSEAALKTFVNGVIADAGIATNEAMEALAGRVTTAEGDIDTLEGIVGHAASEGVEATGLVKDVEALKGLVGDETVAKQISDAIAELDLANTYDAKGAAATAEQNAKDYADGLNEAMDTRVTALEAIDHEHANKAELDKIEEGDKAKWDAMEQNAKDYADGLNNAMDTRMDAIEAKFGDGEGNVESQIAAAVAAEAKLREEADTGLGNRIKAVEDDYLKVSDKNELAGEISGLKEKVGDETVAKQISDAIKDLVDDSHTHENKDVLDGITAEKVAAWDSAEANVHADWNVNDETSPAYIENRPFFTITEGYETTILDVTITPEDLVNGNGEYGYSTQYKYLLTFEDPETKEQYTGGYYDPSATYTVICDGKTYYNVPVIDGYVDNIGDPNLVEYPFYSYCDSQGVNFGFKTKENHTVKIIHSIPDEVVTIEDKYIPDTVARYEEADKIYESKYDAREKYDELMEYADLPSDWEATSGRFIKNRTHYKKFGEYETLFDDVVTVNGFVNSDGQGHTCYSNLNCFTDIFTLDINKHYIVTYKDTVYSLNPKEITNCIYIGNGFYALDDEPIDTNVPFTIQYLRGSHGTSVGLCTKGLFNDKIKVEAANVTYVPLDERYIPDTIARAADVEEQIEGIQSGTSEAVKELAEGAVASNTAAIEALQGLVGDENVAERISKAVADEAEIARAAEKANADAIKAISDDYLKAADKTELQNAIDAAEESAVDRVLGYLAEEVVNEKYDTLKEVAAWIESDTTNSSQLITRVDNIEKDYLKAADKTELQGAIDGKVSQGDFDTLEGRVDTVESDLNTEGTGLKARVAAVESELNTAETGLKARMTTAEGDIDALQQKVGDENVSKQIGDAVKELKDGQLTTMQGEIDEVERRAGILEDAKHTHANQTVLDGIEAADITAWDAKVDSIAAGEGLKATREGNAVTIAFDEELVWIFDCGTSEE